MKLPAAVIFVVIAVTQAGAEAPQPVLPNVLSTVRDVSVDARIDFTKIRDQTSDPTLLTGSVHVQYISRLDLGGYVALPFAYIAEGSFDEKELGNLEVGGLYVLRPGATLDLYARGGVTIDVDGDDNAGFAFDIGEAFLPFTLFVARPADAASTGLDTSWVRAHAGMRMTRGSLHLGAQGGVDVVLDRAEQEDAVVVLAASAAFARQRWSVGGGATLLRLFDNDDADDDTTVTLNAGGDLVIGRALRVFGSLGLNLQETFDGFSIGLGIRAAFGT